MAGVDVRGAAPGPVTDLMEPSSRRRQVGFIRPQALPVQRPVVRAFRIPIGECPQCHLRVQGPQ